MRKLAFVAVLLLGRAAGATILSSPSDPALAGALNHDFCGGTITNGHHTLILPISSAQDAIILTATSPAEGIQVTNLCGVVGVSEPITITFDRPVQAVGVRIFQCFGTWKMTGNGHDASGSRSDSATGACPANEHFVGVSGIGTIDSIVLEPPAAIVWAEIWVKTGAPNPLPQADLAVTGPPAVRLFPGSPWQLPFAVANAGPDTATGVELDAFLPPLTVVSTTPAPSASPGPATRVFDLGEPANGASSPVSITLMTPPVGTWDCHQGFESVALLRAGSLDPTIGNNLQLSGARIDPSAIAEREDCFSLGDDDCDNRWNCADSDCNSEPSCHPEPTYAWNGESPPPELWPPLVLPFGPGSAPTDPTSPPGRWSDWRNPPMAPPPCTRDRHGTPVVVAQYCCNPGGKPASVSASQWLDCVPADPNMIEAIAPEVSGRGIGFVAAGGIIQYRVHYENIGGVDAHNVEILLRLDDNLDDTTLSIDNGGSYDPVTRSLRWIDPQVFPHDPRSVTYQVAMRADAPVRTRARGVATIVFPDADPPTRIDTNVVEHVIPDPAVVRAPDLGVFSCSPAGAGIWKVQLANRGLEAAFAVTARVVAPPSSITVVDGEATFAPAGELSVASPLAVAASTDTVEIHAPGDIDVCEVLTWEIAYTTAAGAARTVTVQAGSDADGDGVADWRQTGPVASDAAPGGGGSGNGSGGCACTAGGAAAGGGTLPLLLVLVTLLFRRRIR